MFCPRCHASYPPDWKVCPTDTTPLLRSSQIGKYTVDGVLGVGGMGAVFRAKNPDTGAAVAVKVMSPESQSSEGARERFKREAGVVSKLDTAHVCKVYDFGSDADGIMFLVMELMKGHTLGEEVCPAPDYMDLARVQMVMNGALKGLTAAHSHGVVHRDLKPDNIFVADTFDGEVPKLLDFGIARVASPGEAQLTRTGALMGTASYMAPEQVAGAIVRIGPWTDVYAMGAILYELLAGAPAFGGDTLTDVFQRVVRGDLVSLRTLRPGLPEAIYALVENCLRLEPTDRPADAEAMRAALLAAALVPAGTLVPPPAKTRVDPVRPRAEPAVVESTMVAPKSKPPLGVPLERTVTDDRPGPKATSRAALWIAIASVAVAGGVVAFVATRGGDKRKPEPAKVPPPVAAPATKLPPPPPEPKSPHPDMVFFAAKDYVIGEDHPTIADALPTKKVMLTAFWIDKNEVTRGQLEAVLGDAITPDTRTKTKGDSETTPARYVDFTEADNACVAMGKRLPTEEEWEAAALSTPQDPKRARLRKTGEERDLAAPSTDCSDAGLCDMLGGVTEWTSTVWPKQNNPSKVLRGPSFRTPPADIGLATIHARQAAELVLTDPDVGFRCVLDGSPDDK